MFFINRTAGDSLKLHQYTQQDLICPDKPNLTLAARGMGTYLVRLDPSQRASIPLPPQVKPESPSQIYPKPPHTRKKTTLTHTSDLDAVINKAEYSHWLSQDRVHVGFVPGQPGRSR